MLVTTLLVTWLEQAPMQASPATAATAWLNTLQALLTTLGILATAVLAILKKLDKAKIQGLEKERQVLTDVATAIAEGVDEVKPLLGKVEAQEVTGAIQRRATAKGVLAPLDTLLAAKGLNQKTRDELGYKPGSGDIPPLPREVPPPPPLF